MPPYDETRWERRWRDNDVFSHGSATLRWPAMGLKVAKIRRLDCSGGNFVRYKIRMAIGRVPLVMVEKL